MPEWTICPECGLKHRQRPDGQCPRCGQPLTGETLSGPRFVASGRGGNMAIATALPDVYDGRAMPRSRLEREGEDGGTAGSPRLGFAGAAMKRLFGVVVSLALAGYVSSYVAKRMGFSAPELEVTDFKCARTMSDIVLTGTVKNISTNPLSLTAKAALIFVIDRRPRRAEGPVTPEPLPPGESGRFEIRTQLPAGMPPMGKMDDGRSLAAGDCRLEAFTDRSTGDAVNYRTPK